jgi:hypothetical protein
MDSLKYVSVEELVAELAKRKKEASQMPEPLKNPDFSKLRDMIISSYQQCAEEEAEDVNLEHYIYERAVEAVFGKAFWEWRNKQNW